MLSPKYVFTTFPRGVRGGGGICTCPDASEPDEYGSENEHDK
jgi:hypothetical protein